MLEDAAVRKLEAEKWMLEADDRHDLRSRVRCARSQVAARRDQNAVADFDALELDDFVHVQKMSRERMFDIGNKPQIAHPGARLRKATNGRPRTSSLTSASVLRSPQPRIVAIRRSSHG